MKNSDVYKILHFFTTHLTSVKLKHKFWRWLESPLHKEEKDEALHQFWTATDAVADSSTGKSLDDVFRKVGLSSSVAPSRSLTIPSVLRVAAMLAIPLLTIAASWFYINHYQSDVEMVECTIPMGEQREIVLSDGTKVKINSESFFIYPKTFRGAARIVYLSGEANFDVRKDDRHPFIVKTAQMVVQALGTKFNVQAYPDFEKTLATLENGSVRVSGVLDPNQTFILKPDEELEYNHYTRVFEKRTVDADIAAGWTQGGLNFVNRSLKEILSMVQKHYNVKVEADSRLFTNDLYTIKLKGGESLQTAIQIIALTVEGVTVEFADENKIILTSSALSEEKGGDPK